MQGPPTKGKHHTTTGLQHLHPGFTVLFKVQHQHSVAKDNRSIAKIAAWLQDIVYKERG